MRKVRVKAMATHRYLGGLFETGAEYMRDEGTAREAAKAGVVFLVTEPEAGPSRSQADAPSRAKVGLAGMDRDALMREADRRGIEVGGSGAGGRVLVKDLRAALGEADG